MWWRILYSTLGQETRRGTILYLGNRHITFCCERELKLIEQTLCSVCVIWYACANPLPISNNSDSEDAILLQTTKDTHTIPTHCHVLSLFFNLPFRCISKPPIFFGKNYVRVEPWTSFFIFSASREEHIRLFASQTNVTQYNYIHSCCTTAHLSIQTSYFNYYESLGF